MFCRRCTLQKKLFTRLFREIGKGSQEIYDLILSQPVKFEIMNDYTRTVDIVGRRIAFLNGDTAVYPSLTARTKYYGPREPIFQAMPWNAFCQELPYFNITEDRGIDDHDSKAPEAPEFYLPWVHNPLPSDLPLINKDKLIQVAAYNGEIDRYPRLRRPRMLKHEWAMVIPEHPEDRHEIMIRCAIDARRIMSNDLTWLTADYPGILLPGLIWYPNVAHSTTYEKLAYRRPGMFEACLRACIVANNPWSWDELLRVAPKIFKDKFPDDFSKPKDIQDPKLW
ncbi:hypothetical protein BDV19DRAFT_387446 [Aspergillus venezuelensis]